MYVSWVILFPFGVLYPAIWKGAFNTASKWFTRHLGFQQNGFILAMIGLAIVVTCVEKHAASSHPMLGIIISGLLVQVRKQFGGEERREEDRGGKERRGEKEGVREGRRGGDNDDDEDDPCTALSYTISLAHPTQSHNPHNSMLHWRL